MYTEKVRINVILACRAAITKRPEPSGRVAMPCMDASGSFDSGRNGLRSG
ncbi:MAG: hypothetical protein WAM05_11900 [Candidatus Binataceae bacterium]|jgi:hypothetical protein